MVNNKIRIALTFDDAPSIKEKKVRFSADRMDKVRKILTHNNIKHCTAFVIGNYAIGHEEKLVRWLDAGFKLGNHTFSHEQCSKLSVVEFKKSVEDCNEILESVGAFSNTSEKWFRFPYLDRGANVSQRKEFQSVLDRLGYKTAHASMSFYDDKYEVLLEKVLLDNIQGDINKVSSRFLNSASKMIKLLEHLYTKQYGHNIEHIAYTHFGPVSEKLFQRLITNLSKQKIELIDLKSASACKIYKEFENANISNGLVLNMMDIPSLPLKIRRKLFHISTKLKLFQQSKYGPIWPYLQ